MMINRDNWKLTKKYLAYLETHQQRKASSIAREKSSLRHLLEWADAKQFKSASEIEPGYPRYLAGLGLAHKSIALNCVAARGFFRWMRMVDRRVKVSDVWLGTLKPVRFTDRVGSHDAYTLAEIEQLVNVPVDYSLTNQRIQASVALLFVSGMRVGAFTTMPISALDLDAREIRQWPELGVEVKGNVRATTFMLNIPALLDVARTWDDIVRGQLPDTARWYTPLATDGMSLSNKQPGAHRTQRLGEHIKRLCERAGVRYRNPHQIRHGHATYALERCRDLADYKAISVNMLHLDIATTDRVYSEMRAGDVKRRIEELSS